MIYIRFGHLNIASGHMNELQNFIPNQLVIINIEWRQTQREQNLLLKWDFFIMVTVSDILKYAIN